MCWATPVGLSGAKVKDAKDKPSTCSFCIPGPIEQGPERLEMLCPSCSDRPARTAMAVEKPCLSIGITHECDFHT